MDNNMQFNHTITLNERKNLLVSGVKKIDRFDNKEFIIDTNMGYLNIYGNDLELIKLDTYQGNVTIKGVINSMIYKNDEKNKEDGLLSKLFK